MRMKGWRNLSDNARGNRKRIINVPREVNFKKGKINIFNYSIWRKKNAFFKTGNLGNFFF